MYSVILSNCDTLTLKAPYFSCPLKRRAILMMSLRDKTLRRDTAKVSPRPHFLFHAPGEERQPLPPNPSSIRWDRITRLVTLRRYFSTLLRISPFFNRVRRRCPLVTRASSRNTLPVSASL